MEQGDDASKQEAVGPATDISGSHFLNAFRKSGMAKALIGLDNLIIEANNAFCALLGFSLEELTGVSWQRFGHPEETGLAMDFASAVRRGEKSYDVIEARVVRRDGQELLCLVNTTVIRDGDWKPIYFVIELQDITEPRRAALELIKSERRMRDLIEQSPMAYSLYDEHGLCLMVNEAWARLWKLPKELPVGLFNVLEDPQVKASGRLPGFRRVFAGETLVFSEAEFDASQVTGSGGKGRKRWIETVAYPVKDDAGVVHNVVFLHMDVTERKEVETALHDSESRYRLLAENSTDMISRHNAEGIYLYVSPACESLLGFAQKQIEGCSLFSFVHPDDSDDVHSKMARLLESRSPGIVRYRIRRADGDYIWFETIGRVVDDQANGSIEIQCASRDITERIEAQEREKEHEQQLNRASRLATLGTLISGIGHEINNPNNYIRLNAQNLAALWKDMRPVLDSLAEERSGLMLQGIQYAAAASMIDDLLQGVIEGSRRIERLLIDLRDFARSDGGTVDRHIDLNAVVDSALAIIGNFVQQSTHRFSFHRDLELPVVQGNYYQLEQVVINLVNNACQALDSPEKEVWVETRCENDASVVLVVRDEGIGIPSDNLLHLADPFFTTRKDKGGSGLGLAITSRIVRDHEGTIDFVSEVGKGTSVIVRFPKRGTAS